MIIPYVFKRIRQKIYPICVQKNQHYMLHYSEGLQESKLKRLRVYEDISVKNSFIEVSRWQLFYLTEGGKLESKYHYIISLLTLVTVTDFSWRLRQLH